jgi:small subunit ribosomal protein S17
MQKTIIVRTMRMSKHSKYARITKRYNKFKVHDEKNAAKIGDVVRIEETRPLSKDKRFRLVEILKKGPTPIEIKEEVV